MNNRKTLKGLLAGLLICFLPFSHSLIAQPATTQNTLLDRIQIEDLMIEYYWAFSTEEGHDIEKFWAADSEFDVNGQVVRGLDAIAALYGEPEGEGSEWPKFIMLLGNPMIRVSGDAAVMDAVYTGVTNTGPDELPVPSEQGTDHVEFIKVNGQWKIKRRVLEGYGYVSREALMDE